MVGWLVLVLVIMFVIVIGTVLIALTVIGAARAWRHQDVGWVAIILGAWVLGMGWAAALFYLVAIDAPRRGGTPPAPRA